MHVPDRGERLEVGLERQPFTGRGEAPCTELFENAVRCGEAGERRLRSENAELR